MDFTYRPIDQWPSDTPIVGRQARFDTSYSVTLEVLDRELRHLKAKNVVLCVALAEKDIRLDGKPRTNARAEHPGIIMAFDSKYGPLKYATGEFSTWKDNIRAVALSLEALRKVDRYGVSKRGEQYTGWKALGTGSQEMTWQEARVTLDAFVEEYGSLRGALKGTHPDTGGSEEQFQLLQRAREALGNPSALVG